MTTTQPKVKALSLCAYCSQDDCWEKEDCTGRASFIRDQHERDLKVIASHSSGSSVEKVLDAAILICQNLYEHHYDISMKEHIAGYDDDDQKEVKQNHWIRACGISECVSKLAELRERGEREQEKQEEWQDRMGEV
jgi:hypothetical protein